MPIVDGTEMVRGGDKQRGLSSRASRYGRIPIRVMLASLVEHMKGSYVDAGLDGRKLTSIDSYILKTMCFATAVFGCAAVGAWMLVQ